MTMSVVTTLLVNTIVFSVLVGFVLGLRKLLSGRISAIMQYALLAVITLKLVIPFGFESAISPLGWFDDHSALPQTIQTETRQPEQYAHTDADQTSEAEDDMTLFAQTSPASNVGGQSSQAGTTRIPAIKTASLHWSAWVFIVWLAGVIVMALWLALGLRSIRRHIRHTRTAAPAHMLAVFDACKRELGINRSIRLVMQTAIPVPSIIGIISPMLIVPDCLTNMDFPTLRIIFLHELTHYKHGDLWVTWIMNGLNCLYWFNPLVWLCFKLIRSDMETICDQRCLRSMDRNTQSGYINTVLHFAGFPSNKRLQAAIAITDGRTNIEKRIRSMFKKRRTSRPVKILVILVVVMMLTTCVLTACQPTPEKPVVVNKGDDKLAEEIRATPAPTEKYKAPAQYQMDTQSFYNDMLSVSFNVQVETPDVNAYPVYIVQDADFSQQQVDRIVSALTQDKPLKYYDDRLTKQEITEKFLLPAKQALADVKSGKTISDDSGNISAKQLQDNIDMYESWIANAPDTKDEHSITAEEYTKSGMLSATVDLGKPSPATLKIVQTGQSFYYLQFLNGTEYIYNGFWEPTDDLSLKTTKEQAVAMATQLVADMGAEDFKLAAVGKTTRLGSEYEISSDEYQNTMAYSVVFTRTVDGIPTTYTPIDGISLLEKDNNGKADAEMWDYERIMINIDDDGIANVFWNGNMEIGVCVNENVNLMQFEDIAQRAMEQIKVQLAYLTEQDNESEGILTNRIEFGINKAKLGFARIRVKDSSEYQIVPVWDFYGTTTYYYDEGDIEAFYKKTGVNIEATQFSDGGYQAIVTLNAIDGSVIDRTLGY